MDTLQILVLVVIYPLAYIFPAYVANGSPVIFGGGTPIDLNRKFRGKPIFGKHKTIRGFVFGVASGIVVGGLITLVAGYTWGIWYLFPIAVASSFGTLIGDLIGSFAKRRMGHKEGANIFLMDQYMFLLFAFLFAWPLGHQPEWQGIIFIIIMTGLLHVATNRMAHKAKIKEVPW